MIRNFFLGCVFGLSIVAFVVLVSAALWSISTAFTTGGWFAGLGLSALYFVLVCGVLCAVAMMEEDKS